MAQSYKSEFPWDVLKAATLSCESYSLVKDKLSEIDDGPSATSTSRRRAFLIVYYGFWHVIF